MTYPQEATGEEVAQINRQDQLMYIVCMFTLWPMKSNKKYDMTGFKLILTIKIIKTHDAGDI